MFQIFLKVNIEAKIQKCVKRYKKTQKLSWNTYEISDKVNKIKFKRLNLYISKVEKLYRIKIKKKKRLILIFT